MIAATSNHTVLQISDGKHKTIIGAVLG